MTTSHLRALALGFGLLATGFGLLSTIGCQHFSPQPPPGDASGGPAASDPAATVDGRTISVGELDAYIKEQLFDEATSDRDPSQLYQLRTRVLAGMIDEMIVEKAAASANLTPEEYLLQQIEAGGDVPEPEIAAFYQEHIDQMGGLELDAMRDRIASYLKEQRGETILANLREQADSAILIEPTRIQVEAIGPSKGPDDAVVTIVEFSDFECPYCQRVVATIEQVLAKYPNQVRFVYRHLPLSMHSRARAAAEAAACAGNQADFWGYHDLIFATPRALSDADLEGYASQLELDVAAFRQCVQKRETQQLVDADVAVAEENGISGTPSFLINGIPLHGAQSLEAFSEVIDSEIAQNASTAESASR